jgi:hypothetical protein
MDQVVGGVDAVQRPAEPGAAHGVADHDVVERHARGCDPLGRTGEAADLVARLVQARHEGRADVAGHPGDEYAHPQPLPFGRQRKTPRERSRHVAGTAVFIPFKGICGRARNCVRFAGKGLVERRSRCFAPARLVTDR